MYHPWKKDYKILLVLVFPKCGLPFIVKATYLEFCLDCGINESKIKNRPHARDAGTMVSLWLLILELLDLLTLQS